MARILRKAYLVALVLVLLAYWPAPAAAQNTAPDAEYSDVVLVIDHSGSMAENDPNYLRLAAAKLFVDLADEGDAIGIVVMSGQNETRKLTSLESVGRSRSRADRVKQAIDGLRNEPMGEETHMGTALNLAYDLLDKRIGHANPRQFVVLLSDGLPTGAGQSELVAQAASRFQERRYWKVFSIALAFKDVSGPSFLEQAVAAPTGAEVVIAADANQLLDKYLDIYARMGDDRFVDRIAVAPNTLATLANAQPDQQLLQMSFVLLRASPADGIRALQGPGGRDVVDPFYQNTVYRSDEPEYELYKVAAGDQVQLAGSWQINIGQQAPEQATVAVLTRSKIRMRLPYPISGLEQDDSGVRYYPVGRPVLLVAGAEVPRPDGRKDGDRFHYDWLAGLTPSVRATGSAETPWLPLTDDGRSYDLFARDGRYSGLLPPFAATGDYRLQVEMPTLRETPVHLRRDYLIRVAALPTMTVTLPPAATTLQINKSFNGEIDLPSRADFTVENVTFPSAFIQRPDGVIDPLPIRPASANRFEWSYTPAFSGAYRISVVAEVQGRGPMGTIRYVDYTEASAAVPASVPLVTISPAFDDYLSYNRDGVINIPLSVYSRSSQREQLDLQITGVDGSSIVPAQLFVEPFEAMRRTITVRLPEAARPETGELSLTLRSPTQQVLVQGSTVAVPFIMAPSFNFVIIGVGVALAGLGAGAWWLLRRRRRRRVAYGAATLRRVA